MALAVQELIRTQGGYTLIADHKVFDTLELPVMGLMSDAGFRYSHIKLKRMIEKAHEMGVPDGIRTIYHTVIYGASGHSGDSYYTARHL